MPRGIYNHQSPARLAFIERRRWQGFLLCGHNALHEGRGYCSKCYSGVRKHGSLEAYQLASKIKGKPFEPGHVVPEEVRLKWSRDRMGSGNPMFGKIRTENEKERISLTKRDRGCHKGSKNSNWRGGISKLAHLIRTNPEYQRWRRAILERDNYTCQNCNKRGGDLNVDHYPKTFKDILVEFSINSIEDAIACEALWNTENNRTLCVPCHRRGE